MKQKNADRLRLDSQRSSAAHYFCENYSREERFLKIFARDFSVWLKSSEDLKKKETDKQYYWDFLISFDSLKKKMSEFRWSSDFLMENGINFKEIRKLYFAVA